MSIAVSLSLSRREADFAIPLEVAGFTNRLVAGVIRHPGAVVAASAMPNVTIAARTGGDCA